LGGRRGAKRVPDHIHLLRGTFKPSRHGNPEDKITPPQAIPDCPPELDNVARAEWKRVTELLSEHGVITLLDRAILAAYCALWSRFIRDPESFSAASHAQLRLVAGELCCSPSGRARISVPAKSKANRFADL